MNEGLVILPLWLFVTQWVLLLAFGFLVISMYRQFGFQLGIRDGGSERDGLNLGEAAPSFSYVNARDGKSYHWGFGQEGKWSVLLFVEPTCIGCQKALANLAELKIKQTARALVIMTDKNFNIEQIEAFRSTEFTLAKVDNEVANKLYRTLSVPFLYVIDEQGTVRSKGTISGESAMRKILTSAVRGISKIEFVVPETLSSEKQ